ncbi:MAG: hypothetical protein H6725_06585 [Sandaracinaceae bacterium]|nr:hypothetical protein [Sandaracinaceae bacterium]
MSRPKVMAALASAALVGTTTLGVAIGGGSAVHVRAQDSTLVPPWMPASCSAPFPYERGRLFASPLDQEPLLTIYGSATYAVVGPATQGRLPVRVIHPVLGARFYMASGDCSVVTLVSGRLEGVSVSFDAGDVLTVVGPGSNAGMTRVRADVKVLEGATVHDVGAFEGDIETTRIAGGRPQSPERLPVAEVALAPVTFSLRATPGGPVTHTVSMPERVRVHVVRRDGAFTAIRVGHGPYLFGWTDAKLSPAGSGFGIGGLGGPGRTPWRVPAGASIELRPGVEVIAAEDLPATARPPHEDGRVPIEVRARGVSLTGVVAPGVLVRQLPR